VSTIPIEEMLFFDAETRSPVDLRKTGSWRYAEDPATDVYMVCWAIGNGPIETWYPGQSVPKAIHDHAQAGRYFSAHNVGFEYPLTNLLLAPRYGWPRLDIDQLHDTAAEAAAMGLPRSLQECGHVLGLETQKDAEGHALMLRMCRPRRIFDGPDGEIYTWWDDAGRVQRLAEYCAVDVRVAREVFKLVRRLPDDERIVWELDQKINEYGIRVDLDLAGALAGIAETAKLDLDAQMRAITGGAVPKCSNAGALLRWLQSLRVDYTSVAKAAVTAMLVDARVPDLAKQALTLRRTAAKSSTAKLRVMQQAAGHDGRLRGMFRYHGANTGRWCLAEGTKILVKTLSGEVLERPIETVQITDLVWDGWEWVNHDGVVFSGEKDVIEHDGVIATPQHKVYVSDAEHITLGEAAERGVKLFAQPPRSEQMRVYTLKSPSGKLYVGITTTTLKFRFNGHIHRSKQNDKRHPLYDAIRKYGPKAFVIEEVASGLTVEEAKALEIETIASLKTTDRAFGYNISPGGDYDGDVGGKAFWNAMRADPVAREEYLAKLSDRKKADDWSDYTAMSAANKAWREANPEEARALALRGVTAAVARVAELRASGWRPPKQVVSEASRAKMAASQRARWTPELRRERGEKAAVYVKAAWAAKSDEQKQDIGKKIGAKALANYAAMPAEEKAARDAQLKAARAGVDEAKRKARQKEGIAAYWTPERRAEQGERTRQRRREKEENARKNL
jgi:predicted GIY-YIG superfamily endonuclease